MSTDSGKEYDLLINITGGISIFYIFYSHRSLAVNFADSHCYRYPAVLTAGNLVTVNILKAWLDPSPLSLVPPPLLFPSIMCPPSPVDDYSHNAPRNHSYRTRDDAYNESSITERRSRSRVAESPSVSTFRPLDTLAAIAIASSYATPASPHDRESDSDGLTPEREEALQRALRAAPRSGLGLRSENRSSPLMSLSHILHGSPDSRTPSQPSLAVFKAPTATYMWPTLQASSTMASSTSGSSLYVEFIREDNRRFESPGRPSYEVYDSDVESPLSDTRSLPADGREDEHDTGNDSDGSFAEPLRTRTGRRAADRATRSSPYARPNRAPRQRQDVQVQHTGLTILGPDTNRRLKASRPRRPALISELGIDDIPRHLYHIGPEPPEWEMYATPGQQVRGTPLHYTCRWVGRLPNGQHVTCGYTAKKQLVKRHIQNTHMEYKPYICNLCDDAFPQKTSLQNHIDAHLNIKRHKCGEPGCNERFRDGPRRLRHLVSVHRYTPRDCKAKHRPWEMCSLNQSSVYESFEPWMFY